MLTRIERAEKIKNLLMLFCDSIKNYEDQVKEPIDLDERSSEEFVDLFLDSEDAYDFVELTKEPAPGETCRVERVNHPLDPEEWSCDCQEAINGEPCRIKYPEFY